MNKTINKIKNLEKSDKTILLLIFTTTANTLLAVIKFVFALTIPSLWFFVNACFLAVLSISRFFSIRNYVKKRNISDIKIKKEVGYKNILDNLIHK